MIGLTITWNRLELTKQTMASIEKDGCFDKHIIIDNGSTDGTVEWLKENTDVHLIALPKNMGISYAMVEALNHIKPDDLLCIMDNDMIFLQDNTISQLESLYHELGGNWVIAPYNISMPKPYVPEKLGEIWLIDGRLVTKRSHVSGCRVVNYDFAQRFFGVQKDMIRCWKWRELGYNVGYAHWLEVEHIGENKGVVGKYLL